MSNINLKEDSLPPINYIIKQAEQLIPGDIILHPIYREDGLMLINRYTHLSILSIKQIHIHLKNNISVIVISSREHLQEFLDNKLYADIRFIRELENIIINIKEVFKLPLSIYSYVDPRVNLESYLKRKHLKTQENIKVEEKENIKIEEEENNTLIKVITTSPLWNCFEFRLESTELQDRAKTIKNQIIDVIYNDKSLLDLISKMKNYDDLLIIHGVNTSCISLLFGLTLELSDNDLIDLAISALFCNIGFTNLKKDIFYNFLKNQEHEDLIDRHIKDSLEILSKASNYCKNKKIIYGILDHHEYYSGGGYPGGKNSESISLFGRIIAIAMTYDELVGGYLESSGILSTRAINIMWENKGEKLDPNILKIYMCRSTLYKVGKNFYNSAGNKGIIIGFSNYLKAPHKPMVRFGNDTVIDYFNKNSM